MQLSFTSVVSLLVAAQTASAWQIIGYADSRTCGTSVANRVLRGSSNACFTFGQSMPGVTCTHYARNGAPAEGCHGHLPIVSIRHGTGENCAFYRGAGCTGDTIIKSGVNGCSTFGDRTTIGSYKCSTR
ncbi:hypothetical protein B0T21DRAFT_407669 [Apiosordaria backusii]|uniref:Uncharacterized protein n=1 Tax=Apiosordaria backusii TaxID=314023 RepID=A0AA40ESA3_9PEZI|nr:hypothetical protein B0T21DRAFT_407669 [Apiosordaria backusii]